MNAAVVPASLPSGDEVCGINFIQGIANTIIVQRPGKDYLFKNPYSDERVFPTVFIPGYIGTPVPVVDCERGEIVAVLTSCAGFNPDLPSPTASIQPNDSTVGIKTCDPNYDIILAGFFILNTGFNYCDPEIMIWDKDREDYNGKIKVTVVEGRIVDYEIEDSGSGFLRIPRVDIIDSGKPCGTQGGFGAKILPIMGVIPKPLAKPLPPTLDMVFCPAKQQVNSMVPETAEDVLNASLARLEPDSTTIPDEGAEPFETVENVAAASAAAIRLAQAQATAASSSTTSTSATTQNNTTTSDTSSSSQSSQQQSSQSYGGGY